LRSAEELLNSTERSRVIKNAVSIAIDKTHKRGILISKFTKQRLRTGRVPSAKLFRELA